MKKLLTIILIFSITVFCQWSLVIIPDSQYDLGTSFDKVTNWIKMQKEQLNVKFVLHLGDIVSSGTSSSQWSLADRSMSILDGVVPYAIPPGNHDYGGSDYWGNYRKTFSVSRYSTLPTWGSTMEPGKLENSYHLFSAEGTDYLIIALEFLPRDNVLAWANSIVAAHPSRKVIYDTHWYMSTDDVRSTSIRSSGQNSGEDQWNEFVKKHKNMLLTVSGHVEGKGYGRRVDKGINGNYVYQMLSNYQSLTYKWYYIRVITFYPSENRIAVRTFSPDKNFTWIGDNHNFDIDLSTGTFTTARDMGLITLGKEVKNVRKGEGIDIEVFPNPVRSNTVIRAPSGQRSEDRGQNVKINVLNISGKIVHRLTSGLWHLTSGITWNPSSLPAGIYILKIQTATKTFSKRLLVQK
jgi:hypothetical protein